MHETLSGSPAALNRFVDRMRCVPRMLAARNARLGNSLADDELEDLTQDTLVSIWRRLASYRGHASLETWVYTFCRLELANRIRTRARRNAHRESTPTPTDEADGGLRTSLDWDHVHVALDKVGAPDATVLRLRHFEQLTFDEIGRRLSMSPNTAKTQYYRGLERLRGLLEPLVKEVGL